MQTIRSILFGLFGGVGKTVSTFALYVSIFIVSTLSLIPLEKGFHSAFDRVPAARDFLHGGGLDLLLTNHALGRAFWASSLGLFIPLLILFILFGLWLEAGIYGLAADEERGFGAFARAAKEYSWGFLRLFLLNLVLWGILGGLIGAGIVMGGKAVFTDRPSILGPIVWTQALLLLVTLNLIRNSIGFAQARWVVKQKRESTWRCFIGAFVFTLKRFIPVNLMTWFFNVVRGVGVLLIIVRFAPGYEASGSWLLTALLVQVAFLYASYLRASEARAQVTYTKAFVSADRFG